MLVKSADGPMMSVTITDEEKETAGRVKAEFSIVLKDIEKAIDIVADLRDALVTQTPTPDDISKLYRIKLRKYKMVILKAFNTALIRVKTTIETMSEIMDPEMIKLREIIIAEIGE